MNIKFVLNPQQAESFALRAILRSSHVIGQLSVSVYLKIPFTVWTIPTTVGVAILHLSKLSFQVFLMRNDLSLLVKSIELSS